MIKFPNIEQYIEYIAGWKDINGKQIGWYSQDPVISLASYDKKFVSSVAEQTMGSTPLTDRQATLAEKMIATYARQLRHHGIDQPGHKNYRLGLRPNRDRTRSLTRCGKNLNFKFPFSEQMIAEIKAFAKVSQGSVGWDHEEKIWKIAITEYNVSWAVTYAKANNVFLDEETEKMFASILEVEQVPYAIELNVKDGKCFIDNVPESMTDYINNRLGGFDDIYTLVDMAPVLGYTVNNDIIEIMKAEHSPAFIKLCTNRLIDFTPVDNKLEDLVEWAITMNRLPIVVYNANILQQPKLDVYKKYFTDDEIQIIPTSTLVADINPNAKVIYSHQILPEWDGVIRLLIAHQNLTFGVKKQIFMSKAEKIAYYVDRITKR